MAPRGSSHLLRPQRPVGRMAYDICTRPVLTHQQRGREDARCVANSGARAQKDVPSPCEHQEDRTEPAAQLLAAGPPHGLSSSHRAHARCTPGVCGSAFQCAGLLLPVLCLLKGRVKMPRKAEGSRAGERLGAGEGRQHPGC